MLVILFGAFVLVDGVSLPVALVRGDKAARRNGWAVGATGVLGIIAGVVTFAIRSASRRVPGTDS